MSTVPGTVHDRIAPLSSYLPTNYLWNTAWCVYNNDQDVVQRRTILFAILEGGKSPPPPQTHCSWALERKKPFVFSNSFRFVVTLSCNNSNGYK
mmetsp:Transcript_9818/g.13835  ORF Transcript_9818/g.13835 Transcript_9818/m.13835 type:complete len:94 (-) Transcript_9818:296-577(-)